MSARPRSSAAAAARTASSFAVYSPHTASAYSVAPTQAPFYLDSPSLPRTCASYDPYAYSSSSYDYAPSSHTYGSYSPHYPQHVGQTGALADYINYIPFTWGYADAKARGYQGGADYLARNAGYGAATGFAVAGAAAGVKYFAQ